MKRVLLLLLALVILSVCLFSLIGASVASKSDKVTITERLSYGDITQSYGAKISYSADYAGHLLWDFEYISAKEPVLKTEYDFSAIKKNPPSQRRYSGISMDLDIKYGYSLSKPLEQLSGIERAYRELYDATPMYETRSMTVCLDDYYTYYPIGISISLPRTLWSDMDYDRLSENYRRGEYEVIKKFKEFFRIPIPPKSEKFEISISKNGNSVGIGSTHNPTYYVNCLSSYTSDKCFFSINNRRNGTDKEEYEYIDTSLIPGGYGIYCFEYESVALFENESPRTIPSNYDTGIREETLKMVFPLEKEAAVEFIAVSEDEDRLFIITEEGGISYFTEIELSTMKTLQKTLLYGGYYSQVWQNDGFFVIKIGPHLMLLAPGESGLYEIIFTGEHQQAVNESFAYIRPSASMDFDGERLIITDQLYEPYYNSLELCDFYIAVYGKDGLHYYGEYENSLSKGYYTSNYRRNCLPRGFSAEWKN